MKRVLLRGTFLLSLFVFLPMPLPIPAQEQPKDHREVFTFLGRTGDFKANVLKFSVPRNDLPVTILEQPVPTPFGFAGWVAMSR